MRKVLFFLTFALVTACAHGQISGGGVYIPNGSGVMPEYFSGTLNQAGGIIHVYPGPNGVQTYMVEAELILSSPSRSATVVDYFYHVPGEPGALSVSLGATFDSTHFTNSEFVRVRVRGTDNLGRTSIYDSSRYVPVQNMAGLANHQFTTWYGLTLPGSQSHSVVKPYLTNNYSVSEYLGPAFVASPWLNGIGYFQFIYVSTHGSFANYQTNNATATSGLIQDYAGGENDHVGALRETVGETFEPEEYPPFNPNAMAPPNFVFVDACLTFQDDFSQVLFPG